MTAKLGIVYKATVGGGVYIGQTALPLRQRIANHVSDCQRGYGNSLFHEAIRKYGLGAVKWEVVAENLTQEQRDEKEIELIKLARAGGKCYNRSDGGRYFELEGSVRFVHLPDGEQASERFLTEAIADLKLKIVRTDKLPRSKPGRRKQVRRYEVAGTPFRPQTVEDYKPPKMGGRQIRRYKKRAVSKAIGILARESEDIIGQSAISMSEVLELANYYFDCKPLKITESDVRNNPKWDAPSDVDTLEAGPRLYRRVRYRVFKLQAVS